MSAGIRHINHPTAFRLKIPQQTMMNYREVWRNRMLHKSLPYVLYDSSLAPYLYTHPGVPRKGYGAPEYQYVTGEGEGSRLYFGD